MVQGALGGCLFLDEAYALSGGGKDGDRGDSFSDEVPRTYDSLLTTHYGRALTTYYSQLTTYYCSLLTAYCLLLTSYYGRALTPALSLCTAYLLCAL